MTETETGDAKTKVKAFREACREEHREQDLRRPNRRSLPDPCRPFGYERFVQRVGNVYFLNADARLVACGEEHREQDLRRPNRRTEGRESLNWNPVIDSDETPEWVPEGHAVLQLGANNVWSSQERHVCVPLIRCAMPDLVRVFVSQEVALMTPGDAYPPVFWLYPEYGPTHAYGVRPWVPRTINLDRDKAAYVLAFSNYARRLLAQTHAGEDRR